MFRTKILSIAFILALFPSLSHGAVLSEQTNSDDFAASHFLSGYQFGTGISGTLDTMQLFLGMGTFTVGVQNFQYALRCYSDSGYSMRVPCAATDSPPSDDYVTDLVNRSVVEGQSKVLVTFSFSTSAASFGAVTFNPSYYYALYTIASPASTDDRTWGTTDPPDNCPSSGVCSTLNQIFYRLVDSGGVPFDTTTRIIITTPYDEQTVATSTSFTLGASGYINDADYEEGMYLYIRTAPYAASQGSVANPDLLIKNFSIPIESAGSFDVSTTTAIIDKGEYFMETSIRSPSITNSILNFLGFGQFANFGIQTATTTHYIAAEPNQFDNFVSSTTQAINDYIASSTISTSSCTAWTEFNLITCLNLLFVPQTEPISVALGDFKNGFLSYFPWGYLTRFVVIMSGSATTTLPSFTATIPVGGENLEIITLDMQEMIEGGGESINTIQDPYSGETLQEIIQPWVRLFIGISILFIIIADIAGMAHHTDGRRRV